MFTFKYKSITEISQIAKWVISVINGYSTKSKVVAFYGKMGAGKTTLIQHICRELNVIDEVTSPTFAIIYQYKTKNNSNIYHFDFYRINKLEEVYDIGYEDYFFSNDYCFIEWPEKIESVLPEHHIKLNIIENDDNSRTVEIAFV